METDYITIGIIIAVIIFAVLVIASGIRIIRPTHRAVIETLGKFSRVQGSGITYVLPMIQKFYTINITEQITEAEPQEIITKDRLNASVDAQVYYKVKDTPQDIQNAFYKVNNYKIQIIALARTTLRNVIGNKDFKEVNSARSTLNNEVKASIERQTIDWGIDIVRTELKEINPPKDVQTTMNQIIMATNQKTAAIDFATAVETKADGEKRARIKESEGVKQSQILEAQGRAEAVVTLAKADATKIKTITEADANRIEAIAKADAERIKLVNESAEKYFKANAVLLKTLEVNQASLEKNTKVVFTEKGTNPVIVIGDGGKFDLGTGSGIIPIVKNIVKNSDAVAPRIKSEQERQRGQREYNSVFGDDRSQ